MAHLILTALWLLFLVCWFVIYFCTAQQQSGGVAWIARYDRQASSFLAARDKLRGQDAAWLAGCAILPGLCAFLWSVQPSVLLCPMPALAGAGLYLLGRMLGGVPLLTALSAAGVAVSLDLHPAAGPFVVAVILFYRWMSLPGDTGFGRELACLGGSGIALLLAALGEPAVWWCLPVALVLGAVCLAQRWREGLAYTGGRLARSLVLGLLLLAALLGVYLVCFCCWAAAICCQWGCWPMWPMWPRRCGNEEKEPGRSCCLRFLLGWNSSINYWDNRRRKL